MYLRTKEILLDIFFNKPDSSAILHIPSHKAITGNIFTTNEKALENPALADNKAIIAQTKTLANTFAQPSSVYDKNKYWDSFAAFWTDLKAADTDDKAVAALNAFNGVLGTNFESNK